VVARCAACLPAATVACGPLLLPAQGSLAAIQRMEGELEAASAKYVLVQGLRAYVADLCSMLQVCGANGSSFAFMCVCSVGEGG
jgi:hypothetical protein